MEPWGQTWDTRSPENEDLKSQFLARGGENKLLVSTRDDGKVGFLDLNKKVAFLTGDSRPCLREREHGYRGQHIGLKNEEIIRIATWIAINFVGWGFSKVRLKSSMLYLETYIRQIIQT